MLSIHQLPDGRIISEHHGDITADVIEALTEMSRPAELVLVEREQAAIARIAGREARDLICGRQIAQINEDTYNYWLLREGPGFWKDKANLRKFLRDNPACRVISKPRRTSIIKN
jgi:hypothetical protein